jgi:hypothetical protein
MKQQYPIMWNWLCGLCGTGNMWIKVGVLFFRYRVYQENVPLLPKIHLTCCNILTNNSSLLTLKWPNSSKFSALHDQMSQRNSNKIYKHNYNDNTWLQQCTMCMNLINSKLDEFSKYAKKKNLKM